VPESTNALSVEGNVVKEIFLKKGQVSAIVTAVASQWLNSQEYGPGHEATAVSNDSNSGSRRHVGRINIRLPSSN